MASTCAGFHLVYAWWLHRTKIAILALYRAPCTLERKFWLISQRFAKCGSFNSTCSFWKINFCEFLAFFRCKNGFFTKNDIFGLKIDILGIHKISIFSPKNDHFWYSYCQLTFVYSVISVDTFGKSNVNRNKRNVNRIQKKC